MCRVSSRMFRAWSWPSFVSVARSSRAFARSASPSVTPARFMSWRTSATNRASSGSLVATAPSASYSARLWRARWPRSTASRWSRSAASRTAGSGCIAV
jgi:hypothetical protein